jgi:hypothetical protein
MFFHNMGSRFRVRWLATRGQAETRVLAQGGDFGVSGGEIDLRSFRRQILQGTRFGRNFTGAKAGTLVGSKSFREGRPRRYAKLLEPTARILERYRILANIYIRGGGRSV